MIYLVTKPFNKELPNGKTETIKKGKRIVLYEADAKKYSSCIETIESKLVKVLKPFNGFKKDDEVRISFELYSKNKENLELVKPKAKVKK